MIAKDSYGNELLKIINVPEDRADEMYKPINHCLAVVKVGDDHLMGFNRYRQDWEIFGGCREKGETLRQCINRECREELGLENAELSYIGLMYCNIAPGYFDPRQHYEYGGLYGISLPMEYLEKIYRYRTDKDEIEKLAFCRDIKDRENIAPIDEKLLCFWDK